MELWSKLDILPPLQTYRSIIKHHAVPVNTPACYLGSPGFESLVPFLEHVVAQQWTGIAFVQE